MSTQHTKDGYCCEPVWRSACGTGQCSRRATKDGYCAQHHPANVRKRKKERSAKWEEDDKAERLKWDRKKEDFEDLKELRVWVALLSCRCCAPGKLCLPCRMRKRQKERGKS